MLFLTQKLTLEKRITCYLEPDITSHGLKNVYHENDAKKKIPNVLG